MPELATGTNLPDGLRTMIRMNRLDGASANLRLSWPRRMAAGAALAGTSSVWAADAAAAPVSAALAAALFTLALAALALTIVAVLALRAARTRREVAEELRAARTR